MNRAERRRQASGPADPRGVDAASLVQVLRREAGAFYQSGRPAEALAACKRLLALTPEDASVLGMAALLAHRVGDTRKAVGLARRQRRALDAAEHARPESYRGLAGLLVEAGERLTAEQALAQAARRFPADAGVAAQHADVLRMLGRHELAAQTARRAIALDRTAASAWITLALSSHQARRHDAAVDAYRQAIGLTPDVDNLYHGLGAALIAAGRPDEAVETADRWLDRKPGNVEALALRGHALQEAGREAEARVLFDFERLVQCRTVRVPDGYADLAAFNAALEAHVLAHPTLVTPPEDDPKYHHPALKISDNLLAGERGPVAALEGLMREAVDGYLAGLPAGSGHPFIADKPRRYKLYAWAAVLDRQGNQHQHLHKDGYLSGCYYVRIPAEVSAQENGRGGEIAGGLEVGRPPDELGCAKQHMTRQLKPYAGLMLLFPAYFYHRTIPFRSAQKRISIAFDVMPD